jgi:plasmid stabilization system protein ParE
MANQHYEVVWTKRSQQHMKLAYDHISRDSVQNAIKVLENIVAAINKANTNPEFYSPDKY